MKFLKILLFIVLMLLSIYLFDWLFLYAIKMEHRLNLWGKIFFFFPILGIAYFLAAYVIGWISSLNPYRWLSYLIIVPLLCVWVGFNVFDLWTMPVEYSASEIVVSSYFTLVLLIFFVAGIYAPVGFVDFEND
jgi:hypothetical protein